MTPESIMTMGQQALLTALMVSAPLLLAALAIGLVVSVFQAMTQINEMTLTFIPKIAATAAALLLFGPWMLTKLVGFTVTLFQSLPHYVR